MPWSNDGGGNNQGPWGQGPWGQGPRKSGGSPRGSGQPPDLDDLLRRAQDKMRGAVPGGWNIWPVALGLAVLFWLFQSIYMVAPSEQGVVLRLGKYAGPPTQPGLHFLMWPVETVEKVPVQTVTTVTLGGGDSRDSSADGIMLAGDQNIVDIDYTVQWKISDPYKYLYRVKEPDEVLRVISESAMREYVARSKADEVRTKGREAAGEAVMKLIQDALDSYDAGIAILSVRLNKAEPPQPVQDAFAEVNRAQQDSASMVNQATQYAFQRDGQGKGEAAKIRQDADAYKDRIVAEAQGEAQRFSLVYDQYKQAKDVTRRRIYLETMEGILSNSKKVILEQGAGVVPYLPLPALNSGNAANTGAAQ